MNQNVPNVPSVNYLINSIKRNLEGNFANVSVMGEVSNLSLSSSGHWYFSMSDADALLSCAIFKMDAMRNPIIKNIKDGDKVICSGSISVYPKRGSFQLLAKRITPVGKGDLKEQFELLKKRLNEQGLFSLEDKKPIPKMPKKIGVITALGAAALADFLNIMDRRTHFGEILISPALVQGEAAPASIRKALEKLIRFHLEQEKLGNLDKKLDVIVITRGGGSLEDLWAFNDEALAYDIYNCPIPIISAVGHQVDFTICDFVADLRAETPSAAAEIISNEQKVIFDSLENIKRHLKSVMSSLLNTSRLKINKASPVKNLERIWKKHNFFIQKLERLNVVKRKSELIPLESNFYELDNLIESAERSIKNKMNHYENSLSKVNSVLGALNPKNVLSRGYAYVENKDGVVTSFEKFNKLPQTSKITLHFSDGQAQVQKIEE